MDYLAFACLVAFNSLVSEADLWATRLAGRVRDNGHEYTVTYVSPRPAVVLWGTQDQRYFENSDTVEITSRYSNGQGVSTLLQSTHGGATVSLLLNDSYTYYVFQPFVGEEELPPIELYPLGGTVLEYTRDETFVLRLRSSNLGNQYSSRGFSWLFNLADTDGDQPVLETTSSFGPQTETHLTDITTVVNGDHQETTADVNLGSRGGVVTVLIKYDGINPQMDIFKGASFIIKQADHISPYQEDFIGVSVAVAGEDAVYCINSTCRMICDAYGADVVKVEVVKIENETVLDPLYQFKNNWFATSEYQFPETDFTQRYACRATNANNKTVQKEARLINLDAFTQMATN